MPQVFAEIDNHLLENDPYLPPNVCQLWKRNFFMRIPTFPSVTHVKLFQADVSDGFLQGRRLKYLRDERHEVDLLVAHGVTQNRPSRQAKRHSTKIIFRHSG